MLRSSTLRLSKAPAPFRGPAADSRLGELLLDVLPIACGVGNALDLHHARWLCGTTLREGVRRPDGSLNRAGFLGGTADMMARSLERQAPWLAEARKMEREGPLRETQLIRATEAGDERRVRELIAAGVPLELGDRDDCAALQSAAWRGRPRIAELLLDGKFEGQGANVDRLTVDNCTPLIIAAAMGHEACVRVLLARGADVTLQMKDGSTALRSAETDATKALLRAHGATE